MATAATVRLTQDTAGVFHARIPPESADLTSELLQKNHDKHHMYFNQSGFHNHIAHHLLTIFALGANPGQIQTAYDVNAGYQRPQFPVDQRVVADMSDPDKFRKYLANERYFHDYEIFFRKEIESSSWQQVLNKYVFADTPLAKDMLTRMYAGFYHPIIHLGFGVEFVNPAIMVEALAQAATHDNWPKRFLEAVDAKVRPRVSSGKRPRPLIDLIHEARNTDKVRNSAQEPDGNKLRDGVLKRAFDETVNLCSQWWVQPTSEDLRLRTAEMINVCALFAGASQHPSRQKQVKFDFFYIHCLNCSVFYSAFLQSEHDSWLSNETRAKLLMYKGWSDIGMYVSRGAPELIIEEITEYKPKHAHDGWPELFNRINAVEDDGHASKLVRALANGEQACKPYGNSRDEDISKRFIVRGDMWLKLGHMAVDSVEGAESRWVRNAGFDSAWKKIPKRGTWPDGAKKEGEEIRGGSNVNGEGYEDA